MAEGWVALAVVRQVTYNRFSCVGAALLGSVAGISLKGIRGLAFRPRSSAKAERPRAASRVHVNR